MFISTAWAQAASEPKPSFLESMFPMILIFMVFYFLFIVPQKRQRKKHSEFLEKLKRGDEVLTNSGIFGRVEGITDQFVTLEVADEVRIKILKSQIAGLPKEQVK